MKSIIQITEDIILIGDADNSGIIEVRKVDCNFEPSIGDKVNVFNSEKRVIVTKIENTEKPKMQQEVPPNDIKDRININIVNENTNKNDTPANPIVLEPLQRNVVNKTTYLLLAFFLGGLGGHKFYSGKTGLGILYLVFCWTYIPSLIALIEFISACFKNADSNGRIIV